MLSDVKNGSGWEAWRAEADAHALAVLPIIRELEAKGIRSQHRAGDAAGAVRESRADQQSAVELAAPEFRAMNEDLKGSSLADVLEKLEKGKIGHRAAMEWLNVKSYDDLVEVMHVNGRLMPGHQPMRVAPETRALVRRIFRPVAQPK